MAFTKESVRRFWDEAPNGTRELEPADERAMFLDLERIRDEREPFIERFAQFRRASGQDVLEVGVGAGTDHIRFARAGARCSGVDLSEASAAMTRRRFAAEGLTTDLRVGDAEHLPFESDRFDLVYSWGVIHHTPDTPAAAREIVRVLRPGGRFCVMVYNRHSLVALQTWLVFAAARGHPLRTFSDVLAHHMESPGTQAFTAEEARALFDSAVDTHVETVVTPYDMRIGRRRFLPSWSWRLAPGRVGWFHVVTGRKQAKR